MSGSGSRRFPGQRSRGVHGRSGFSSLFKSTLTPSSSSASAQQETQPLLQPSRRTSPPVRLRDSCATSSLSSSSNSGSYKGSDSSPTPRRSSKYSSCSENHGIKPPTPEQYLTPLQQKEVCIRHLRAKLKETEEKLDERGGEVEDLKLQLSRMQEDWIEEECHRVEAQLSLKEARKEIKQLKQVIDTVKNNLVEKDKGIQKYFIDINIQNKKLETLLHSMELAQDGASQSAAGSPARSLTRSSTYTKLSEQGPELLVLDGTDLPHRGSLASGIDRAAEAAALTARSLLREGYRPSARIQLSTVREQGIQTDFSPCHPDLEVIAEKVLRSSTFDPGGLTAGAENSRPLPDDQTLQTLGGSPDLQPVDSRLVPLGAVPETPGAGVPEVPIQPALDEAPGRVAHWSRYYIVDLLAVTVPAVPTVAWIVSTQRGSSQPVYNIGVLLRSCCVLALQSLRRFNTNAASPNQPLS
ncbi:syntaphilin-like [Chiloscyllium plagiosum]|uniref:syntaphilin-like n=1 Tax=Chiloscyllium plagiosum TaxID=36176 RepID=UPI001CB86D05|nr:syntaphilin-like [Chiloscyllium plagiosum]XP_043566818.1 syntaphilin-like [Chiloscyllium plagiosum]XP_043566819.1 syntaphilin-like [Chiloscyllium plagiosum]XP_043566820.1 syntaphilin-like [Chiloscyllium plagiosum]XP_043566821.1 syntaphilin-like [Chiloscyllium plagiosum]